LYDDVSTFSLHVDRDMLPVNVVLDTQNRLWLCSSNMLRILCVLCQMALQQIAKFVIRNNNLIVLTDSKIISATIGCLQDIGP
jgi:hypothetical protein